MRLFQNDHPFLSERTLTDLGLRRVFAVALGNEGETLCAYFSGAPDSAEREVRRRFFRSVMQNEEERAFLRAAATHAHEIDKLRSLYGNEREREALYWLRRVQSYTATVTALATTRFSDETSVSERVLQIVETLRREHESATFKRLHDRLRRTEECLGEWRSTALYWQVANASIALGAWCPTTEPLVSRRMSETLLRLFGDAPEEAPRAGTLAQADAFFKQLCAHEPTVAQALEELMKAAAVYPYAALEALARDIRVTWDVLTLLEYCRERAVPLCDADVQENTPFAITQGVDLSLLDRTEQVVANDFHESMAITLLHGANSGGKTAFMRMVGQCVAFAAVGLPAPAVQVHCPVVKAIHTVFTQPESLARGRLAAERDLLAEATASMDCRTLLLINEVFSSTSEQQAASLSEAALRTVFEANAKCLWNTHHTLPTLPETMVYASYAPLVDEDGTRRFVIQKQAQATSKAADIAARYGLRAAQLTARLQARGLLRGGKA